MRSGDPRPASRPLPLLGTLDRYVAAHFVSSYATALLLIVGLFWIFDLAGNLDDYLEPWPDGSIAPVSELARYYVLNMPYLFLQVAPFVTLVAGLFTLNRLLRKNEVVAVLAGGVSAHRLLLPVLLGGLVAGAAMFAIREWAQGTIAVPRESLLDRLEHQRVTPEYDSLWLRDLSGSIVRLGTFRPATSRDGAPDEVAAFEAILRDAGDVVVVNAPRARWDPQEGVWRLQDGVRHVMGDKNLESTVDVLEGFEFTPDLARTYRRARDNPLELSFSEIGDLMRRDPDNVVYQTLWQYQLTFPLANLVLLLVGLPVMMAHERRRSTDRMVLGGLLCVFYFGVDFVFRNLGLEGDLSPLLASWTPVLLFGSLGVVLFESMRT